MKDFLGITCSGLCLMHCLALPVLVAIGVPAATLSILQDDWVHLSVGICVLMLAFATFPFGFQSHKRVYPMLLAMLGLTFLGAALVVPESAEVLLTAVASFSLIAAHVFNHQLLRSESLA